jgi:hypothetical protein
MLWCISAIVWMCHQIYMLILFGRGTFRRWFIYSCINGLPLYKSRTLWLPCTVLLCTDNRAGVLTTFLCTVMTPMLASQLVSILIIWGNHIYCQLADLLKFICNTPNPYSQHSCSHLQIHTHAEWRKICVTCCMHSQLRSVKKTTFCLLVSTLIS